MTHVKNVKLIPNKKAPFSLINNQSVTLPKITKRISDRIMP